MIGQGGFLGESVDDSELEKAGKGKISQEIFTVTEVYHSHLLTFCFFLMCTSFALVSNSLKFEFRFL